MEGVQYSRGYNEMISYALIANGQYNPFLATPLPEHMYYPISQNCKEGIDLDYGALVLGEKFVVDATIFEDILHSRKEYFNPMKKSLKELKASYLLETRDYSLYFKKNKEKIIQMTDFLLESVDEWLLLEQKQWSTLEKELAEFQNTYGSKEMRLVNTCNIGIESWLARTDQIYNTKLRKDLYDLFDGKKKISEVGIANTKGALQFIVAQIVMSDLISDTVHSPILDWDDSKGMYERLFKVKWDDFSTDIKLKNETDKLFNVIIPDLKPNNINAVIQFMCNNKAVSSLRETLIDLISNGESVSQEWMTKYINQIMAADLAVQRKSSIFQFFGTLAGLIPGPWIQGVAVSGVTSVTDKILFHKEHKYDWYYALQKKV